MMCPWLYGKLYKKYYPITSAQEIAFMNTQDINELIRKINHIEREVDVTNFQREVDAAKSGIRRIRKISLLLTHEQLDALILKLLSTRLADNLDNEEIEFINDVIYRHKYNSLISIFVFPIRHKCADGAPVLSQQEKKRLEQRVYKVDLAVLDHQDESIMQFRNCITDTISSIRNINLNTRENEVYLADEKYLYYCGWINCNEPVIAIIPRSNAVGVQDALFKGIQEDDIEFFIECVEELKDAAYGILKYYAKTSIICEYENMNYYIHDNIELHLIISPKLP